MSSFHSLLSRLNKLLPQDARIFGECGMAFSLLEAAVSFVQNVDEEVLCGLEKDHSSITNE